MSDEGSTWRFITELLSLFNSALKDYLSKKDLEDTYGLFLGLSFFLAISIGAIGTDILMTGFDSTYYIMLIIVTFILSPIALLICGYIVAPIYGGMLKEEEPIIKLLTYQLINLLVGLIFFFGYKLDFYIYSSWIVFIILGFIHPLSKHIINLDTSLEEIKNTLNKMYIIITMIYTILSLILKYVDLLPVNP